MVIDLDLRTVILEFPREHDHGVRHTDSETWITMLEQSLACNYKGYSVSIMQDAYERKTTVCVVFDNVEDATWFRLQRG